MFECHYCFSSFNAYLELVSHRHVHEHLPQFVIRCSRCTAVFSSTRALKNHIRRKHRIYLRQGDVGGEDLELIDHLIVGEREVGEAEVEPAPGNPIDAEGETDYDLKLVELFLVCVKALT